MYLMEYATPLWDTSNWPRMAPEMKQVPPICENKTLTQQAHNANFWQTSCLNIYLFRLSFKDDQLTWGKLRGCDENIVVGRRWSDAVQDSLPDWGSTHHSVVSVLHRIRKIRSRYRLLEATYSESSLQSENHCTYMNLKGGNAIN